MRLGASKIAMLVVVCMVVFVFLPQVPGCVMASMPKTGRVIDATTGNGMSNITVMGSANFYEGPFLVGPSSNHPIYHVITHTDAQGNYRIPSTWLSAELGIPGTHPTITWVVTAFEPNYSVVGDEDGWSFNNRGEVKSRPKSTVVSPPARWRGDVVEVSPINMYRKEFSLKEAAIYYRTLLAVGIRTFDAKSPEEAAVRNKAYAVLMPVVCAMDFDISIDRGTGGALADFAANPTPAILQLNKLVSDSLINRSEELTKFGAVDVCQAMKAGEVKS